ncbi:DNA-binding NtrC family response regulator [Desulfobotulus alkaliphilus]|uniref:DNA-binding NtrC family response regulator n=1 Tax=Desulfobotulus alkaliphilus TaxID=622671 RepID=A0A562RVI2_9BACT|nr:sigma-54 dependent transcriptional regulator [Desulfobotulus alkaliphilus]TWI72430.1 DNA-binding NtrC family response regulator [Desulfobotulus alkaliphilus]
MSLGVMQRELLSEDAGVGETAPSFMGLVGQSASMQRVFKTIRKVAATDSSVLITGESGTGKELIARAIHHMSSRKNGPLVVINCGAIPGELLESELFGHEKGAFTGAHRSRMGRFEMAHGGTIFLDEIGDMSPGLQVKLLRAIQEQTFERVGGAQSIHVDMRVLSATHRDLVSAIGTGDFREDLYYRLNVIPIKVPPLRERKEDIPLLCSYFLDRLAARFDEETKTFSPAAQDLLLAYEWPGNIRELENMMERMAVMSEFSLIGEEDLPESVRGIRTPERVLALNPLHNGMGFAEAVDLYQKTLIIEALNRCDWVKAQAAALLKMNRTTLVEKIKKLKIVREEPLSTDLDFL